MLRDGQDAPISSKAYVVEGTPDAVSGMTDADGKVSFEVPVVLRQVRLRVDDEGIVWNLQVGELDPIEEETGVLARLRHLGFVTDLSRDERFTATVAPVEPLALLRTNELLLETSIEAPSSLPSGMKSRSPGARISGERVRARSAFFGWLQTARASNPFANAIFVR